MTRRRGPTRGGERLPLVAFAFAYVCVGEAGNHRRRNPVTLEAEAGVVGLGPGVKRREEALGSEFGEGQAPVMADIGAGRCVQDQVGQVRLEIVAAALLE